MQIGAGSHLRALQMAHGLIADVVTSPFHLLEELGVALRILAHHEERGLYPILVEGVKYPRRNLGYGTVVEGEIYCFLLLLDAPDGLWKQHAVKQWWAFYEHDTLSFKF